MHAGRQIDDEHVMAFHIAVDVEEIREVEPRQSRFLVQLAMRGVERGLAAANHAARQRPARRRPARDQQHAAVAMTEYRRAFLRQRRERDRANGKVGGIGQFHVG
ncbi:hypothetical protein FEP41_02844 [Burkholderia multivorans]|nr:hypothetical protein [Burkholderia multivorans]